MGHLDEIENVSSKEHEETYAVHLELMWNS